MILEGILWLLTWPIVIISSYFLIVWALKHHETNLEVIKVKKKKKKKNK